MELASVLSALVAVIAAIASIFSFVLQRRSSQLVLNIMFLNDSMRLLAEKPTLLSLHNIDAKQLAADGISMDEFVYILNTVYAGQSFHALTGRKKIKLSEYRRNLLANEKFHTAWHKYIRDKMTTQTAYAKAIDAFYKAQRKV